MPLLSGKSTKTFHSNIKEVLSSYKRRGQIGTSKPAKMTDAIKQAVAIAYKKKGESN